MTENHHHFATEAKVPDATRKERLAWGFVPGCKNVSVISPNKMLLQFASAGGLDESVGARLARQEAVKFYAMKFYSVPSGQGCAMRSGHILSGAGAAGTYYSEPEPG